MVSPLAEADLHNLVDGRVDAGRRADLLRRLAGSPSDRALVEAWQEQTDIIRAAFRDIENEPLPVALNLAPPRLRCVDSDPLRQVGPTRGGTARRGSVTAAATALVIVAGLAASWWAIGQGDRDGIVSADATPVPVDATALADRATAALAADAAAPSDGTSLPTVKIPDLSALGLRLTGVSSPADEPTTLVLRYRDDGQGRVAISAARTAPGVGPERPTPLGATLTWRRHDAAFAIAGTLPAARLLTIATSLQDDTGSR